jgi:Domain of unknown function (DUF4082)
LKVRNIPPFFSHALKSILVIATVLVPFRLSADSLALSPTGPFQSYSANEIDGFAFSVTSALNVTALGIFAGPSLTLPVGQDFEVGLWTDSGTLLSSTFVSSTDPSQNSFYFHAITPISLTIGQNYVVGAQTRAVVRTYYSGSYTMADGLAYTENRWMDGSTFTMPIFADGPTVDPGYLGGNLLVVSTPEPDSAGVALVGLSAILAGIAFRTRKRRARFDPASLPVVNLLK